MCALTRNESDVIGRMVQSCRDVLGDKLAGFVFTDTGSTDQTVTVARSLGATVVQHPFVDFAANRNLLLQEAYKQGTEWVLMLDPDMTLEGSLPTLEGLGYEVDILGIGASCFTNPRLLSTKRQWRYEGVVHEALADYPGLPRLEGFA